MKKLLLTTALLATAAMPLRAEDPPKVEDFLTKQYDVCMDKSGGVTASILDCMGEEFGRQDKVMNANYQALIKAYGAKSAFVAKLRKAQRLWLAMVAGESNLAANPGGGSSEALTTHSLTQKAVVLRGQEFKELLLAKTHGINSEPYRLVWSAQLRECGATRFDSGMVCDAKTLPSAREELDAASAKLIKLAAARGHKDYVSGFENWTRDWNNYVVANCDVLVAGKIYSNPTACLEDATRIRRYAVLDAIEMFAED